MAGDAQNIVFFGSTGCGKSSVVNMILGSAKAPISSGAEGCTFEGKPYSVTIGATGYVLWDTAGLDEGREGRVVSKQALKDLSNLVLRLSLSGGVSLLVLVMRGPRITEAILKNYQTFYDGFCNKNVPIVIVVTGMENEDNMDEWWIRNGPSFTKRKMFFKGSACITAIVGKSTGPEGRGPGIHAQAYEQSIRKVEALIVINSLPFGWRKPPKAWIQNCWKWIRKTFRSFRPGGFVGRLVEREAAEMILETARENGLGTNFEDFYDELPF